MYKCGSIDTLSKHANLLNDHFTTFNGWMDSRADPWVDTGFLSGEGGPGPTARIQDPHMGPIHRIRTNVTLRNCVHACVRTHIHTYIDTHGQTGRETGT